MCSQRSWTSAISIGNTSEERQSICHTLTERGKIWSSILIIRYRYLTELGWLTSLLPSVFYGLPIRMNKNRFEEDDGIDMNDIERFLPHLRSVSRNFFLFLFWWISSLFFWLYCRLPCLDPNPFISCQTVPPGDVIVDSQLHWKQHDGAAVKIGGKKQWEKMAKYSCFIF